MESIPRRMVLAALMAALTAAGAFVAIPIGPVPIVLQNLFVMLAALLLGPRWGLASVGVYLLAGALGLPVFAGGAGGVARLAGPTGGYLLGYLPAVAVMGALAERGRGRMAFDLAAMLAGTAVLYACGVGWLKTVTGMPLDKTVALGMLPFLPGDALKIAAALWIARQARGFLETGPGQGRPGHAA
jgi:biotin transport system substrate-specific component